MNKFLTGIFLGLIISLGISKYVEKYPVDKQPVPKCFTAQPQKIEQPVQHAQKEKVENKTFEHLQKRTI
jgi:hypothetical protein